MANYTGNRLQVLTGRRFGRLVVQERAETVAKRTRWFCLCDCGTRTIVGAKYLVLGASRSCGCLSLELRSRWHGGSKNPEYNSWTGMIERCEKQHSPAYPRYGGRGIQVCDRWKSFTSFYEDMGPRPTPTHTLDRINNDGNYEPSNCRWATMKEQAANRSNTRHVTYQGRTQTVSDWARESGMTISTLGRRLDTMPIEQAFNKKLRNLSNDEVELIRQEYATGQYLQKELAVLHGLRRTTIGGIIRGEIYTKAEGPTAKPHERSRPCCKLNPTLIREIRMLSRQGLSGNELARRFKSNSGSISLILRGKSWGWVTDEEQI